MGHIVFIGQFEMTSVEAIEMIMEMKPREFVGGQQYDQPRCRAGLTVCETLGTSSDRQFAGP